MAQPDTIENTAASSDSYQPVRAPRASHGWSLRRFLRRNKSNPHPPVTLVIFFRIS